MSASIERLSVPPVRKTLPRPLTAAEQERYLAIADVLCCGNEEVPPPSRCPEFAAKLEIALATRSDAFDTITAALAEAPTSRDGLEHWLRRMHDEDSSAFTVLSTVAAGAYLMVPAIRAAVGYPGQRRDPAGLEEAADQIGDGILDPVLERGHFYVPTPEGA
ncbi:hypothetical protein [Saccharopolyspora sp. ASAGF58]|uniref:hypothetical protein n=1 Tax=Saccharopolyspora sp. ASAGF58 TaxID=2719023 RepID=UPI0014400147|nr:hypothetical protein [Saccharopolyspora sp. ASAGF58]QIZ37783.1 hypothetical protein FDZ84_28405 [Saccharopolyspora sp. ASAGF58]